MVLAASMDARGHGRGPRTRYRPEPWTMGSVVAVVASMIPVVMFFVHQRSGSGGLVVSTYPLAWPQVSAPLLAVLLLLCIPALLGRPAVSGKGYA